MGRRAEPTLSEPRFPNNEQRLEIRGSVWRVLQANGSWTAADFCSNSKSPVKFFHIQEY